MFWSKPTVLDDRARRVEPLKLNAKAYRDDPDLSSTVGRIHESIWNTGRIFSMRRTLPILVAIVGIFVVSLLARQYLVALPPWAPSIMVWITVFTMMRIVMVLSRRKHAKRIVESVLRIGRCPACGYDLRAAAPESDGACVCPECGAAWKQERIGHAPVARVDLPVRPDMPGDTPSIWRRYLRFIRRTPTIVDDRDRSVARVGLDLPGLEEQIGAEHAQTVRRAVASATALRRFGCALPVAFIGLAVVTGAVAMFIRSSMGMAAALPLLFAGWMVIVYTAICWRMLTGRLATASVPMVKTLRRAGICPSCAAYLAMLPADADGCTPCARCGSAWKLTAAAAHPPLAPSDSDQDSMRKTTRV